MPGIIRTKLNLMVPGDRNDRMIDTLLLLIIVLAGTLLRTWDLFHMSYTHDELSAILRTRFPSFHELIENGVKVDGHPAGIQVFLYYWIKLFGDNEWIVRLPFILAGIFSIPLVFLIGRKWFNSTIALSASAFLACLQYPVMYSQLARPYATGLFFVLAMVFFWDKILFEKKTQLKWYAGYVFFAVLCAYNHHFSLLFVIIVWITGILIIPKKSYISFLLAALLMFLLYLPHLPVFLAQLKLKGLDWLGKPEWCFPINYLEYIFHYSWYLAALIMLILIFSTGYSARLFTNVKWRISLSWCILPLAIGFIYSILIQPVIQYSVLLFGLPFLLFSLFGRMKQLNPIFRIIIVFSIIIISTFSLILERKHFEVFYLSAYKEIPLQAEKEYKKAENKGVSIILDGNHNKIEFYLKKLNSSFPYVWADSFPSRPEFIKYLKSLQGRKIIYAEVSTQDQMRRSLVEDEFPYLEIQHDYFTGNFFEFSKDSISGKKIQRYFSECNSFDNENAANWSTIFPEYISDMHFTSPHEAYKMTEKMEWGPEYSIPAGKIFINMDSWLDISVNIFCEDSISPEILLIAGLKSGGKQIYWNASDLRNFWIHPGWNNLKLSLNVADLPLQKSNLVFSTNIWNKGMKNIFIDDYKIELKKGNRLLYSLVNKIN